MGAPSPDSPRARRLVRWMFRRGRPWRERWAGLPAAVGLVLGASLLNAACEGAGMYERLEWADLDRFQRTASPTDPGGVALVHVGEEEYERYFGSRSPLEPGRVTDLVAAVCAANPRVVAVDLLTGSWPAGFYREHAAPRLEGCPVVWIRDGTRVASADADAGPNASALVPGRVLGASEPPAGTCSAIALFQPDPDGVVRRYQPWFPTVASEESRGASRPMPSLTGALARLDLETCAREGGPARRRTEASGAGEPPSYRIRFTSHDNFPALRAWLVLESRDDPETWAGVEQLLHDRIVILGGIYRHARDRHLTPLGAIHGSELLASSVYTARMEPIRDVSWVQAFLVTMAVGMALLILLAAADLRWPWAALASLVLSAAAAGLVSWHLFNYLGYFLGVLVGLIGVVLAELTMVLWPSLKEMWSEWLREYPRSSVAAAGGTPPAPPGTQPAPPEAPPSPPETVAET